MAPGSKRRPLASTHGSRGPDRPLLTACHPPDAPNRLHYGTPAGTGRTREPGQDGPTGAAGFGTLPPAATRGGGDGGPGSGPVGRDHRSDRRGDRARRFPGVALDPLRPAPLRGRPAAARADQHGLRVRGRLPGGGRRPARPRLPPGLPPDRLRHLRRLGRAARARPGGAGTAGAAAARPGQPQRARGGGAAAPAGRGRLRPPHPARGAGRLGGVRHLGRHRPAALSTPARVGGQAAANRRAYGACVALVCAVLGLAGLALSLALGLAPGLGERAALSAAGAAPADPERWPRYHNLVEGLCATAGLPVPALYVVDSAAANAFAVGRRPDAAMLVVTGGLLGGLNRVELEGVLAHELAHVQGGGARLATLGVALPPLRRLTPPRRREPEGDEGGARPPR